MESLFDIAISHHVAGRLPEAAAAYRRLLAENPNDCASMNNLGLLADWDEAFDLFNAALDLAPWYDDAYNNLAKIMTDKHSREYGELLKSYPNMMRHGGIELSNTCNLKCSYCPTPTTTYKKGFAEDETVLLAIKYKEPGSLFSLHREGEPLLHPKLLKYIRWASCSGLKPMISTNGLLLTEEHMAGLAAARLWRLTITLHTSKSVAAFNQAYDFLLRHPDAFSLEGICLGVNKDRVEKWLKHHQVTVEAQRYIRQVYTHTWAGNVGGAVHSGGSKENAILMRQKCRYINGNICSIRWDGSVVACCFDSENKAVVGHIADFPKLAHRPEEYELCETCDPNWATGGPT